MENKIRVLLIDDDEDEYILLKEMFAELPGKWRDVRYILKWVRSKKEALEASQSQPFDIFLVDYNLDRDNGLEVIRSLRASGTSGPFILLTGHGSYELDLAAMEQGAADYLQKNQINEYVLERSIRYTLERQAILDQLEQRVQDRTAQLSQSEARFRTLTETTSAAIFIVRDRIIRYVNPAARFVTGYSPDELEGTELWRLAHPDYQALLREGRATGWVAGLPIRYEVKIIHKSGEERWLDVTAGRVDYDGGRASLLTAFDITERDRAERELRIIKEDLEQLVSQRTEQAFLRAEELDGLQRATTALLSTLELDQLFGQILSAAKSAIPAAERGFLSLVTTQNGREILAFPSAMFGDADEAPEPAAWTAPACMLHAAQEHRPVSELDEQAYQTGSGIRAWIASPLLLEQQVFGVLALGSNAPGAFRPSNLRLLASFADAATTALQNAILHNEMKDLAEGDPLTGRYNRRAFFDLGQSALERARRAGVPVAAIMIDIDDFKALNDTYGHTSGDVILREIADRCRSRIRESDMFGRYGGDEFVILLPGAIPDIALQIAQRIFEYLSQVPFNLVPGSPPMNVSISMGATQDHPGLSDLSALINEADRALYEAKRMGKGRMEVTWSAFKPV